MVQNPTPRVWIHTGWAPTERMAFPDSRGADVRFNLVEDPLQADCVEKHLFWV